MLEKFFTTLAHYQEKHPWFMVGLILVFTIFMSYFAFQLETDSSFDVLYTDDSPSQHLNDVVTAEFGSNDGVYVLVSLDEQSNDATRIQDVRDPSVLKAMSELSTSLRDEAAVTDVFSIADIYLSLFGRLPQTHEESITWFSQLPEEYQGLVSDDYSAANIIVNIELSEASDAVKKMETSIIERLDSAAKPTGVQFTLTGEPVLRNHVLELLIGDNIMTVLIALGAILVILTLFFRSGIIGAIAVIPVILTLIWLAGTMRLLHIPLSVITAAIGTMMVGMSVDYSIHMTHGFYEQLRKKKKHATLIAVTHVGGALVASALTTLAGFIAMTFGSSPMTVIQGTVLSLGITFALLTSVLLLPAILILYRKIAGNRLEKEIKQHDQRVKNKKTDSRKYFTALGKIQSKKPWFIILLFLIVTLLLLPGISMVRMDTDDDNWFEDDDPFILAIEEVSNKFSGLSSQTLLVFLNNSAINQDSVYDLRDTDFLDQLASYDAALERLPTVGEVSSPTDVLLQTYRHLPQNQEEVNYFFSTHTQTSQYFNEDYSIIKLTVTLEGVSEGGPGVNNDLIYYEFLNEAQSIGFPEEVYIVGQGGFPEDIELNETLQGEIVKTTLIGFLLVFLIALLIYRSLAAGTMAIIPVIFSALWTVSIMGYVDLPFTVLTTGMLSIVMGIGIDYSIHLIHSTKKSLSKGVPLQESIISALTTTGEAIFASTITTIVGFSALILASLLATQRLGMTLAIAIAVCFFICILLVPTTLVIEQRILEKKQRRKQP